MKRVLGILMVCALLVTGLTAIVSAEEATSIAITTQEGPFVIGDTVTATVKLNNYTADSWSAMTITVNYDPAILAFDDVESGFGEDIGMVAEDKGDKVLICWIAQKLPVPQDSVLAKVNFTAIAKTTEAIKITSSFVPAGIANQGSTVPVDNSNGDIFDAGVVETPQIEVAPEAPLPPAAPTSATITSTKDPENKVSFNVNANYDDTTEPVHVYKVDISWDEMIYTYSEILDWDNTTHSWFPTEESAKWGEIEPKTITMINHSSQPVTATVAYEATLAGTAFAFGETAEATEETLSVSFDACAEGTPAEGAPKKQVYAVFNPGETTINQNTSLGIIKITLA